MKIKRLLLTMAAAVLTTIFMGCDDSSDVSSKDHNSSSSATVYKDRNSSSSTTVQAETEPTTISQESAERRARNYVFDSLHNAHEYYMKNATWYHVSDIEYLGHTTGTLSPQENKDCYKFLISGTWGGEATSKTGNGSKFCVTIEVPVDGGEFYAVAVAAGY